MIKLLRGKPILLVPPDAQLPAEHIFGKLANIITELPPRDDEAAWARIRLSALLIYPDKATQERAVELSLGQGCDRVAMLQIDSDIWDSTLDAQQAADLLQKGKQLAKESATNADISIVEMPASNPEAIPLDIFWGAKPLIETAAVFAGVTASHTAIPALITMAGATRGSLQAIAGPGHIETVVLNGALVMKAGGGKSNSFRPFDSGINAMSRSCRPRPFSSFSFHPFTPPHCCGDFGL
jgi:hypothetical protein